MADLDPVEMRLGRHAGGSALDAFLPVAGAPASAWFLMDSGNTGSIIVSAHARGQLGLQELAAEESHMATLGLPGQGYGIRYEFGIFEQVIRAGQQVERADEWLRFGNPWEIARPEHAVLVKFGGTTQHVPIEGGGFRVVWQPADTVAGVPHDVPVAGYRNNTVNTLGLLETMIEHDVRKIVFSSTAATYGENEEMPLREGMQQQSA